MKKAICLILLAVMVCCILPASSADEKLLPRYEYAIVKWEGPDRLFYNLPDKFELVYLSKTGVQLPKEAQAEEYCLMIAANVMGKEGWEPVSMDSRRILFRRAK